MTYHIYGPWACRRGEKSPNIFSVASFAQRRATEKRSLSLIPFGKLRDQAVFAYNLFDKHLPYAPCSMRPMLSALCALLHSLRQAQGPMLTQKRCCKSANLDFRIEINGAVSVACLAILKAMLQECHTLLNFIKNHLNDTTGEYPYRACDLHPSLYCLAWNVCVDDQRT